MTMYVLLFQKKVGQWGDSAKQNPLDQPWNKLNSSAKGRQEEILKNFNKYLLNREKEGEVLINYEVQNQISLRINRQAIGVEPKW